MKITERNAKPDDLDLVRAMAADPSGHDIDEWMPWVVRFLVAQEERVASAMHEFLPDPAGLSDVLGYGLTHDGSAGEDELRFLPVVFVPSSSEPAAPPEPKMLGVPATIPFEGEELPVQVVAIEKLRPLQCVPGIPVEQHHRLRPVPPGCAIRGLDPNGVPLTDGSGGAMVQRRPVNPAAPMFLLSAKHVLVSGGNLNMMQPWIGNPATDQIGSTIAASAQYDAAICEVNGPTSKVLCVGAPRAPIPPFLSLKVHKSGAATGHTGSRLLYNRFTPRAAALVGTRDFFMDNQASYPAGSGGVTENFVKGGDSGSVAFAGSPDRPGSFGTNMDRLIQLLSAMSLIPALLGPLLRQRMQNAAVGLIHSVTSGQITVGGTVQGVPVAVATEMQVVLDDLNLDLVL